MRTLTIIAAAAGLALSLPAASYAQVDAGVGVDVGTGVDTGVDVGTDLGDTDASMSGSSATATDIQAITDESDVAIDKTTTSSISGSSNMSASSDMKDAIQGNAAVAAKLSQEGYTSDDVVGAETKADGSVTLYVEGDAEQ